MQFRCNLNMMSGRAGSDIAVVVVLLNNINITSHLLATILMLCQQDSKSITFCATNGKYDFTAC